MLDAMRGRVLTLLMALLVVSLSAPAGAQIASSDFTADADGWLNVTLPYPSAIPPINTGTYAPTWVAELGGYIRLNDPDGGGQSGDCQYWQAPAEYLGFKSAAYGGTLQFDLANSNSGFGGFVQEDVILIGSGLTLVHALAPVPVPAFTHYSIPMDETGWKVGAIAGPPATSVQFKNVLFAISALFIRAEHQLGLDVQFLDNVTLNGSSALDVPLRAPAFELGAPVPNPTQAVTRIALSLPRAARGEVAVFEATGRRVTTLARGPRSAGVEWLAWDGHDDAGRRAPAGIYWVRAQYGSLIATQRVVRLE